MRLSDAQRIEQDEHGDYLCPDCTSPYNSILAAASCGCDEDA